MPSWQDFQPFIVTGLALGGVYALSGVGLVVLYRATGVLNLAFGAVGAFGALLSWELINNHGWSEWAAYLICVLFGAVVTLLYGVLFGPPLASRDPLVKATATLGLALILLGAMSWIWSDKARSMVLPTSNEHFAVGQVLVNWTQVIGFVLRHRRDDRDGRLPALHEAWHGHAGARQRPRDHGDSWRPRAAGRGRRVAGLRAARGRRGPAAVEPGRARRGHAHLPRHLRACRGADRSPATRSS